MSAEGHRTSAEGTTMYEQLTQDLARTRIHDRVEAAKSERLVRRILTWRRSTNPVDGRRRVSHREPQLA